MQNCPKTRYFFVRHNTLNVIIVCVIEDELFVIVLAKATDVSDWTLITLWPGGARLLPSWD